MAYFQSRFFSEVLGMQTEAMVIIPQETDASQIGVSGPDASRNLWPCLWLLHGLSDDHSAWQRRTSIERYAESAGMAVIMPNVHRSFYTDMCYGGKYWTHLTEELPRLMGRFFPISFRKEHQAVAGLSMGGYGAAKWLMRHPERFAGGASLSGVMDIVERIKFAREVQDNSLRLETLGLVYGDRDPAGTEDDLFALASRCAKAPDHPPLLQICGTEDFLYADNLRFRDHARSVGLHHEYREGPGDHDWGYWDREIQTVIAWLGEQGFGRPSAF
ncbi:MAG: esterase family protein [Verrucomicrobia bacterium]|nr:esterase family protein [Verrucomicrobiota bacterium]MCH8511428.1 esterase family protein [Kiritimatiellia bacterium]